MAPSGAFEAESETVRMTTRALVAFAAVSRVFR